MAGARFKECGRHRAAMDDANNVGEAFAILVQGKVSASAEASCLYIGRLVRSSIASVTRSVRLAEAAMHAPLLHHSSLEAALITVCRAP